MLVFAQSTRGGYRGGTGKENGTVEIQRDWSGFVEEKDGSSGRVRNQDSWEDRFGNWDTQGREECKLDSGIGEGSGTFWVMGGSGVEVWSCRPESVETETGRLNEVRSERQQVKVM